jgi:hypothetical protein
MPKKDTKGVDVGVAVPKEKKVKKPKKIKEEKPLLTIEKRVVVLSFD